MNNGMNFHRCSPCCNNGGCNCNPIGPTGATDTYKSVSEYF